MLEASDAEFDLITDPAFEELPSTSSFSGDRRHASLSSKLPFRADMIQESNQSWWSWQPRGLEGANGYMKLIIAVEVGVSAWI